MRNSEGFDDVNNGDSGDVDEDAGDVVEDAGHGDEDAGDVDEDFQVPHHPLPFPTSGLWFHPLSYDSKVNTFLFIPNEIKITRQSKQCGFSIYTFDNLKSKSLVRLVKAEKMVLSGGEISSEWYRAC